jgi:hypothetical protein
VEEARFLDPRIGQRGAVRNKRALAFHEAGKFQAEAQRLRMKVFFNRFLPASSIPDPGSGAFLTPGSGIRNRFFLGSRIQSHIIFWGKKFYNSLLIGPHFLLRQFNKKNNFQFCNICGYKKKYDNKFFFRPSLLLLFLDPGWIIIIPNPQHCP